MGADVYIPPKTQAELHAPHPEGTRHAAITKIAMSLLGNGMLPDAVFAQLRGSFPPEKTDKEIRNVISWCAEKHPTPSGFGNGAVRNGHADHVPRQSLSARAPKPTPAPKTNTPEKMVDWLLNGNSVSQEEMLERSPIKLTGNGVDTISFFSHLYDETDFVNIVCAHTVNEKGKANPRGGGKTLARDEWIKWFQTKGIPKSEAGAWIRMNPCGKEGTGKGGAVMDCDITSHRFLLLESDTLSPERQLALYSMLKLPIAALISSGAKSVHAWLKLNVEADAYDETVLRILKALAPFGFDQSNKNPSRLSRLPGVHRTIGAVADGMQKLIYLNPEPPIQWGDETAEQFETALTVPLPDRKPFKKLIENTIVRYDELYENRGNLGVQIGIDEFDRDTGGFKGGQMTVLAAGTNGGKSSTALNFINGAMKRGTGTALFTLEMDRDEIVDLLISMNCMVNRNVFNTGFFSEEDLVKITMASTALQKLPLWIYDDAVMTVTQIRNRVMALLGRIGLVVIDYVQIVSPDDYKMPREQQVAEIARGIRILAKETKLPFIVLSQLNDEGKLRESRVVAHEAHNVLLLDIDGNKIEMNVAKGRRIRRKKYELAYQPEYCLITSPAKISEEDVPAANI